MIAHRDDAHVIPDIEIDGCTLSPMKVINRLCQLQADVTRHLGFDLAADCFCLQGDGWGSRNLEYLRACWRNDGRSLAFIERVTHEAIERGETQPEEE